MSDWASNDWAMPAEAQQFLRGHPAPRGFLRGRPAPRGRPVSPAEAR